MKKFLSMVLALVMAMSLVTISAGAKDFTDAASINYKEATDVMSALGVIDGYADGSFNPSATLTRGAAAKIICNLILGPDTASALTADSAVFPDVPASHTFAGYIAYCAKEGIINGYEDGNFRPAGTLTGYAFLKMLLGALGYDAVTEGYVGSSWTVSVAKAALDNDLTDGNDSFVGTQAVNREEACQYALNTLTATMVEYENNSTVTVGNVVISNNSKAKEVSRNAAAIDYRGGAEGADGTLQFCEKYFPKLTADEDADDFGRPARSWEYKNETVGTYAGEGDLLATLTGLVEKGQLYSAVGKKVAKKISDGDVAVICKVDGNLGAYVDDTSFVEGSTAKVNSQWLGRGSTTYVYYFEDDAEVHVCTIEQYLFQATSDYSTTRKTVNVDSLYAAGPGGVTSISGEDFDVAGVKEDDYLIVTYSRSAGEVKSVTPARTVSGSVTTYRAAASVSLGTTPYPYAGLTDDAQKNTAFSVGENATLVVDALNNVMWVDEVSEVGNYVYISDAASSGGLNSNALVAAYFTDGTYKEITVKKYVDALDNATTTATAIIAELEDANAWYTYTVDADGKYTVKEKLDNAGAKVCESVANTAKPAGSVITRKQAVQFLNADVFTKTWKANSSTVFFFRDGDDDVTVYTGVSKLPELRITANADADTIFVSAILKDNVAEYVFVDYNALGDATSTDDGTAASDYLFIMYIDNRAVTDGDDTYYTANAIVNGTEQEIKLAEDATIGDGYLYKNPKVNSKGFYTSANPISGADTYYALGATEAVEYTDGVLSIADVDCMASNTKVNLILVDGANNDLMSDAGNDYECTLDTTAKALAATMNSANYTYEYNAFFLLADDGSEVVDTLYVFVYEAAEIPA